MKKNINFILVIIPFSILGAIIGFSIAYWQDNIGSMAETKDFNTPFYFYLLMIPTAIFSYWWIIAIHELGHVIAELSQKFKFRFMSVGPILLEKENDKYKLRWNKGINVFGGLALCLPDDTKN
ncbi:MAG: hypothetical protein LAT68_06030 [Cyclobacteriaceae bacterium]|nr:hypothetical protein [Cyclobacteriaceae bacterium]MCH8515870.1 hypothetical protein [Cyclobacteriaceae bacterium]